MIRFLAHQYRYARRVGFGRREALSRAISAYKHGF